nr:pyridoxal-phosphate dependent enzyme [Woeseiaceae bacterium]
MTNFLGQHCPGIGSSLPVADLVNAPTPLTRHEITIGNTAAEIWIKHDEASGSLYGGNKVRKLAYILARAQQRRAQAIATFGAVGSHHALATALYARALGFEAICLLGHQSSTEHVREALSAHVANGTRIVRYGGDRRQRIATLRRTFRAQRTWVVPAGGSSWLGAVGFIDAALELAQDLAASGSQHPRRLYVANGTMGTVAGLGLGLALAGLDVEVQAVRITS